MLRQVAEAERAENEPGVLGKLLSTSKVMDAEEVVEILGKRYMQTLALT